MYGAMNNQFKVLFRQSESEFKSFMRLSKSQFFEVLGMIEDDIHTNKSTSRDGISAKEKLMVTLRFLAGGESHTTLSLYFMIGRSTISKFIPKVLRAIIHRLGPLYAKIPTEEKEWRNIERRFANRWDYPNVVGAIDGKHVQMMKPRTSGSTYFNYKQSFSMNLMAVVDADYKFLAYDIGSPGRMSDSGIWNRSDLRHLFEPSENSNPLNIPPPQVLVSPLNEADSRMTPVHHHLIGDDGFGLSRHLMKPYGGQGLLNTMEIFNYRLSRARQCVEVAFGILVNRFRCLMNRVHCIPRNARLIVEASVILHNYLLHKKPLTQREAVNAKDVWYQKLDNIPHRNYKQPSETATEMRDFMREYFLSEYEIDSQYHAI